VAVLNDAGLAEDVAQQAFERALRHAQVYVQRRTRWVYMSIHTNQPSETVVCQIIHRDGTVSAVGTFALDDGYGYWGAPATGDASPLVGARLIGPGGTVVATANFPPL
jgi:hypothetical protein